MALNNAVESDAVSGRLVRVLPPKPPSDSSCADHLRLLETNPFYAEMVRLALIEKDGPYPASTMLPITKTEHLLYCQRQKIRKRVMFLYEDYEECDSPSSKHVNHLGNSLQSEMWKTWFKKTGNLYTVARKAILLDAMTEVMLTRSWNAKGESNTHAKEIFKRVSLMFACRWIFLWAGLTAWKFDISKDFRKRLTVLRETAKDKPMFDRHFEMAMSLCNEDDIEKRMRMVHRACVSMHNRWDHHAKKEDTYKVRELMEVINTKDMIFRSALYITTQVAEESGRELSYAAKRNIKMARDRIVAIVLKHNGWISSFDKLLETSKLPSKRLSDLKHLAENSCKERAYPVCTEKKEKRLLERLSLFMHILEHSSKELHELHAASLVEQLALKATVDHCIRAIESIVEFLTLMPAKESANSRTMSMLSFLEKFMLFIARFDFPTYADDKWKQVCPKFHYFFKQMCSLVVRKKPYCPLRQFFVDVLRDEKHKWNYECLRQFRDALLGPVEKAED